MSKPKSATAQSEPDRMPGPWKIATALLGALSTIIVGVFFWLNGSIADAKKDVVEVRTQLIAESKERASGQSKTDNTVTEIKGKVDKIDGDVKRIEEGLKDVKREQEKNRDEQRQNFDRLLDAVERRGRSK